MEQSDWTPRKPYDLRERLFDFGLLTIRIVTPKNPPILRRSLEMASRWPVGLAHPVFAWVVQNWVERSMQRLQKGEVLRNFAHAGLLTAELVKLIGANVRRPRRITDAPTVDVDTGITVIRAGERGKAVDLIRDWCSVVSPVYLKIADQYFGPKDLELLKAVTEQHPHCRIQILTSQARMRQLRIGADIGEAFLHEWSLISSEPPPALDVTVVSVPPHGTSPIHDRWWVTEGAALDFGTSANSLGVGQDSSVTEHGAAAAATLEATIDNYLNRTSRWTDAGRIIYASFSL